MAVFKCKMCGGTIEFEQGSSVGVCDSCGTKQTLPKLDDDKKSALYDRANHFRRNNEFDKAMGIYEQILNEDNTDAEAYWSLVLCRYGIEYVEDPTTHKRVPTVNRAQYTSVYDDDNYKSALQYADDYQREIYEEEAKAINEIQKGILAISQKEEPFDVFICYKETDANGRRTQDSVLANDLYHQLTNEGFKVFFSRITLEDKLGTAYEPYIFAALNSAKVMVVLGTKPEYFNSVWVKNEWSRFLALVKQSGGKKILIPAYRDMDPYDLPEEFAHLQAQDMSKLGFMQDLIRGIKKLIATDEPKTTVVKETVSVNNGTDTSALLKRAALFLANGDWSSANQYCEKVLDIAPENAEAYFYKLLAELKLTDESQIKNYSGLLKNSTTYKDIIRFGSTELKERMHEYELICRYNHACTTFSIQRYEEAKAVFDSLGDYLDAKEKSAKCLAIEQARQEQWNKQAEEERQRAEQNALKEFRKNCKASSVLSYIILALLLWIFLLGEFDLIYDLNILWPILLLIPAVVVYIINIVGGKRLSRELHFDYPNEKSKKFVMMLFVIAEYFFTFLYNGIDGYQWYDYDFNGFFYIIVFFIIAFFLSLVDILIKNWKQTLCSKTIIISLIALIVRIIMLNASILVTIAVAAFISLAVLTAFYIMRKKLSRYNITEITKKQFIISMSMLLAIFAIFSSFSVVSISTINSRTEFLKSKLANKTFVCENPSRYYASDKYEYDENGILKSSHLTTTSFTFAWFGFGDVYVDYSGSLIVQNENGGIVALENFYRSGKEVKSDRYEIIGE